VTVEVLEATLGNSKKDEVLQEAIAIFGSRGYRATSMRDLADQVKLSKSALYHYFRSKQDLLVAIYKRVIAENIVAAERITEASEPPVVALRQMLIDRVVYTCYNRHILQIFHEEEAELPKRLMREVVNSRRVYQDLLTDLIQRGLEQGDFEFGSTPSIVANCLLGACNWSYKWYKPDGAKTPEELAEEVVSVLLGGVLSGTPGTRASFAYGLGQNSTMRA
jgi:AcrR family transcriptional regulator